MDYRPWSMDYGLNNDQTRDYTLRTLRQKHGVQGKCQRQMPVQHRPIEFERGAIYQREL